MPSDDALAALYAEHYAEENIRAQKTRMESSDSALQGHVRYLAARYLAKDMKILDFGAGTGTTVNLLRADGYDVDGFEFSAGARRAAQRRYGFALLSGLAELPPSAYDVILMIEVIEHLADPSQVLRHLNRALKPGGMIYISTPNLNGLVSRVFKARWREARKSFHLMLFNYLSLKSVLNECGFSDVRHLRFSPTTSSSFFRSMTHRLLQLVRLYGGLRVVAYRTPRCAS